MHKAYEPVSFEGRIYEEWEKKGYFRASDDSPKPPFTIPLPPPNVTGALHNGHALVVTIEDALTRWKRMSGYNALWLPGIDHAGIATQMVVERELAKEGTSRQKLGREAFLKRVWDWKEKHGGIIVHQMKKLGASPDWERSRFTMDPGFSHAVRVEFVQLYNEGLIYRGTRITSRCTRCETVLSDLEVVTKERKSHLWHIRYPAVGGGDGVVVATTRPETMLGDSAVAVHPEDERYRSLVGRKVELPLTGRQIPVIADAYVDKEFGSGALKVTPAHDFNDYEIGQRHKLPLVTVIDFKGRMTDAAGAKYKGLTVAEARERVVADLTEQGLLVKIEDITQQVGLCQRCESVVEPLVSEQWFMKMKPLADKAIEAARKGEKLTLAEVDKRTDAFKIVPEMWMATYYHWMENIRDWCVSRQLWWGHRIPAWYCDGCGKMTVAETDVTKCPGCGNAKLRQDEDVLDTWFSSGLWPFATLGWPEKTKAYKTFYPASILETGFDILFFWVARMLMLGIHFNEGRVPFTRVYLHAMVRDEKGQKMSKTKGNVIDPLDLIRDHGADAFRFTLLAMSGQGRDIKLSLERIEGYQAFCNKLWNASRYVLMRLGFVAAEGAEPVAPADFARITGGKTLDEWLVSRRGKLHPVNAWILSQLESASERVSAALGEFRMGDAAQEIYSFTWQSFCDWYIEFSKELLRDPKFAEETQVSLAFVLRQMLALAHPFIPFITEEIFKNMPRLPGEKLESLMVAPYPGLLPGTEKPAPRRFADEDADATVGLWMESVERLRAFRGENGIAPKARPDITFDAPKGADGDRLRKGTSAIVSLAQLGSLKEETGALRGRPDAAEILVRGFKMYVGLKGLVDVDAELKRLDKERAGLQKDIEFVEKKLSRPDFIQRAPAELVAAEREKLAGVHQKLAAVDATIAKLTKLK
jgi:valyl-tRNA synthetase